MDRINKLEVHYHQRKVGTLALYQGYLAAFEYDREWIADGFTISPFSLPLRQSVWIPKQNAMDGLFGVFADSLPDGWGRLLVDRLMLKNHINPAEVGGLGRLSIVGASGMGALTYEPKTDFAAEHAKIDLDEIAKECEKMLQTDYSENLDELFRLGGTSGGARPKILTQIDGEEWLIKFPSSEDKGNIGKQEYDYSLCAKKCGIEMEQTRLFPSSICEGYFGTKRFDRRKDKFGEAERVHMISAAALLETSHRIPNLDYHTLMKLTLELTKDFTEAEKLFRRMCFNVFAHNRDDHSKNFTYLYEEKEGRWVLSPAYDLTYSYSIGGEHATTVDGEGKNPNIKDMLAVAKQIGIKEAKARSIAEEVRDCVMEMLWEYL